MNTDTPQENNGSYNFIKVPETVDQEKVREAAETLKEKKSVHKPHYKAMYEKALKQNDKLFFGLIKAVIIAGIGWLGFIVLLILRFV